MKENWISVKEALPKLPDAPWCNIIVAACNEGDAKSRPMVYAAIHIESQLWDSADIINIPA